MKKSYDWTRYWIKRGNQFIVEDGSFLVDPNVTFLGKSRNPTLLMMNDFWQVHCLVFTGEPGSGKSTEIEKLNVFTESEALNNDDFHMFFDFKNFTTDTLFVDETFNSEIFHNWQNSERNLYLFFDSLDEGICTISKIANTLAYYLGKLPVDRLYLRIACRGADWPQSLEETLNLLWEKEDVLFLELAPLRKQDVIEACKVEGLDSEKLFVELKRKNIIPFACLPISLSFLLGTYSKTQSFPRSRSELFEEGCLILCEEHNQSRIETNMKGQLSRKQRLLIAGRIAFQLILSNKSFIELNKVSVELDESSVSIEEIDGYKEIFEELPIEVNEENIKEVLSTGLFKVAGSNKFIFVHRSYSEFLAAWYLSHKGLEIKKISWMFCQQFETNFRIFPQIQVTAAWLGTISQSFFEFILENDPSVLLLGELNIFSEDQKNKIVTKLFSLIEDEKWSLDEEKNLHDLRNLNTPQLADTVRSYLTNESKPKQTRLFAIELATQCELSSVELELVNLCMNHSENMQLRIASCFAISHFGSKTARKGILPLAFGYAEDDVYDELKGISLESNWPCNIDRNDLLNLLTPVKVKNYYGAYKSFLYNLPASFLNLDKTNALIWAINNDSSNEDESEFDFLVDRMIIAFWNADLKSDELNLLAKLILNRLRHFKEIINRESIIDSESRNTFLQDFINNYSRRRQIVSYIVNQLIEDGKTISEINSSELVYKEDFLWIKEQIITSKSEEERKVFSELLVQIFDVSNHDQFDQVYELTQKFAQIADIFVYCFGPIFFDSRLAKSLRSHYEYKNKNSNKKEEKVKSTKEEVIQLLEKFELGKLENWVDINYLLALSEGEQYSYDFRNIMSTFGWKEASEDTRKRLVNAAKVYLEKIPLEENLLNNMNFYYHKGLSGYRALYLLAKYDRNYLSSYTNDQFSRWVPTIVFQSNDSDSIVDEIHEFLLQTAREKCSYSLNSLIGNAIEKENKESKNIFSLKRFSKIIDISFENYLCEKLSTGNLFIDSFQAILFFLLERKNQKVNEYISDQIKINNSYDFNQRFLIVMKGLIIFQPSRGWIEFIRLLENNREFCKQIINSIVRIDGREFSNVCKFLKEDQVVKLIKWLFTDYPLEYKLRDLGSGFHEITAEEEVISWRSNIIINLSQKGTLEAVYAIRDLKFEFPQNEWLQKLAPTSEISFLENSWSPPSPTELLSFIMNEQNYYIQNAVQLTSIILESLTRLQDDLQGETPGAEFLWDKVSEKGFRPKDENKLSDYVKKFIEKDLKHLIFINREVEIKPPTASKRGENLDLLISASSLSEGGNTIHLVIETKCIWNSELLTSMKQQLLERYLKTLPNSAGIYLVGWYESSKWDKSDFRYSHCAEFDKSDLEQKLQKQANELSSYTQSIKAVMLDVSY